jgi:hypothetical protein
MPKGVPKVKKEEKVETPAESAGADAELLKVLAGISAGIGTLTESVQNIDKRVKDIETGGKDRFKEAAKAEDIEAARTTREGIDSKINAIVDELLGEDFGVKVAEFPDRPGFLLSLIVPPRLSDNVTDKRPKMDPENPSLYLKDSLGNVIFEDYMPEDRRSRAISSLGNYDTIRQHCERVRAYIVSYFQKTQKPLPEFKVR